MLRENSCELCAGCFAALCLEHGTFPYEVTKFMWFNGFNSFLPEYLVLELLSQTRKVVNFAGINFCELGFLSKFVMFHTYAC